MIMARTASFVVKADASLTKGRFTWVHMALIAALASVGTSWFYQTPVIAAKAEQLPKVEQRLNKVITKDVPRLKAQIGCEHARGETALASAYGAGPDPDYIGNCPPISTVKDLGKPKS